MEHFGGSANQYNTDSEAVCILEHGFQVYTKQVVILNKRINRMTNEFSHVYLEF